MTESVPEAELVEAAREHLGQGFERLAAFADLLAAEGVLRGLIGPREVPRLWERHLLNSAALEAFVPTTGTVIDVGSGAGLPGVVLACLRPDQRVVLVEPMERRVAWLREVATTLGLTSVEVHRGRAEELHGSLTAGTVTARAVAPLDRLVRWCLPLVEPGGSLLALKGSRAAEEVPSAEREISRLGGAPAEVLVAEVGAGLAATTVVRVRRVAAGVPQPRPGRRRR